MSALSLSPRILDRYIFRQLVEYFLLGVVVFGLVAFFASTMLDFLHDVQKFGVDTRTMLTLIGLQLPAIVSLILPASSFLAALIVYSQLNNQFEIIAMRMNGISLARLMVPPLVLGVLCSVLAYLINDFVVPSANRRTEAIKRDSMQRGALPTGSGQSFMFKAYDNNHNLVQMIYVRSFKGQELGDSTIIDLSSRNIMQIIQAKSGRYQASNGWMFRNANIYLVATNADQSSAGHSDTFYVRELLNRDQLQDKIKEIEGAKNETTYINSSEQNFGQLWQAIQNRTAAGKDVKKSHYLGLWKKLTWPLSCLVIILSAVPLALSAPRAGSNRGFVFAIGILFLYYVVLAVFEALGKADVFRLGGVLSEPVGLFIAAWAPIVLMSLIGLLLLRRKTYVL